MHDLLASSGKFSVVKWMVLFGGSSAQVVACGKGGPWRGPVLYIYDFGREKCLCFLLTHVLSVGWAKGHVHTHIHTHCVLTSVKDQLHRKRAPGALKFGRAVLTFPLVHKVLQLGGGILATTSRYETGKTHGSGTDSSDSREGQGLMIVGREFQGGPGVSSACTRCCAQVLHNLSCCANTKVRASAIALVDSTWAGPLQQLPILAALLRCRMQSAGATFEFCKQSHQTSTYTLCGTAKSRVTTIHLPLGWDSTWLRQTDPGSELGRWTRTTPAEQAKAGPQKVARLVCPTLSSLHCRHPALLYSTLAHTHTHIHTHIHTTTVTWFVI